MDPWERLPAATSGEVSEWSKELDSTNRRSRLGRTTIRQDCRIGRSKEVRTPEGRDAGCISSTAPRRGENRLVAIRVKSSVLAPEGALLENVIREERCLSGRKSLIRNQVYGFPVPWVRIPPSPPINTKKGSEPKGSDPFLDYSPSARSALLHVNQVLSPDVIPVSVYPIANDE